MAIKSTKHKYTQGKNINNGKFTRGTSHIATCPLNHKQPSQRVFVATPLCHILLNTDKVFTRKTSCVGATPIHLFKKKDPNLYDTKHQHTFKYLNHLLSHKTPKHLQKSKPPHNIGSNITLGEPRHLRHFSYPENYKKHTKLLVSINISKSTKNVQTP